MGSLEERIRSILEDLKQRKSKGEVSIELIDAIKTIEAWLNTTEEDHQLCPDVDFAGLGYKGFDQEESMNFEAASKNPGVDNGNKKDAETNKSNEQPQIDEDNTQDDNDRTSEVFGFGEVISANEIDLPDENELTIVDEPNLQTESANVDDGFITDDAIGVKEEGFQNLNSPKEDDPEEDVILMGAVEIAVEGEEERESGVPEEFVFGEVHSIEEIGIDDSEIQTDHNLPLSGVDAQVIEDESDEIDGSEEVSILDNAFDYSKVGIELNENEDIHEESSTNDDEDQMTQDDSELESVSMMGNTDDESDLDVKNVSEDQEGDTVVSDAENEEDKSDDEGKENNSAKDTSEQGKEQEGHQDQINEDDDKDQDEQTILSNQQHGTDSRTLTSLEKHVEEFSLEEAMDLRSNLSDEEIREREDAALSIIKNSQKSIRLGEFSIARDIIRDALRQAPWLKEAQNALNDLDRIAREDALVKIKKNLEEEQDIKALDESLQDAESILDLLESDEEKLVLQDLIAVAKDRYDEKRKMQGQITSISALDDVMENVNARLVISSAIDDGEKNWFDQRIEQINDISVVHEQATDNLFASANGTVNRFFEVASSYVPKHGFRHPGPALRYLDKNLGIEELFIEAPNLEELFIEYSDKLKQISEELIEKLVAKGLPANDAQFIFLLAEYRSKKQAVRYKVLSSRIEEKESVQGSGYQISENIKIRLSENDKTIGYAEQSISDFITLLFGESELHQEVHEYFNDWLNGFEALDQEYTGKFIVTVLDESARNERRSIVEDWQSQLTQWERAQKIISDIRQEIHPIKKFELLNEARLAYPFHAELPTIEENVLAGTPAYISDLVQSGVKKNRDRLSNEENDALLQRKPNNTVTAVEDIPVFREIQDYLSNLLETINLFSTGSKIIEEAIEGRKVIIQEDLQVYYGSKDPTSRLSNIIEKFLDEISELIKNPHVTEAARSYIEKVCSGVRLNREILFKEGNQIRIDEGKLNGTIDILDKLDEFFVKETEEKEVKDIQIASWVLSQMRPVLDRVQMNISKVGGHSKALSQAENEGDVLRKSRIDVKQLVDNELNPFKLQFNQKKTWREQVRQTYNKILEILDKGDVQSAYQSYQQLDETLQVDKEIQFLYGNKISASLSEEEWLNQARIYYQQDKWVDCISEASKVTENPALTEQADLLRKKAEIHEKSELIDSYWKEEDYFATKELFTELFALRDENDELNQLFLKMDRKFLILQDYEDLQEKLKVDQDNGVEKEIRNLFRRMPELNKMESSGLRMTTAKKITEVLTVLDLLNELLSLNTSRKAELGRYYLWLGKYSGISAEERIHKTIDDGNNISEEILKLTNLLYDLQTKYKIYSSLESRGICKHALRQYYEQEDKTLFRRVNQKKLEKVIENWEEYAGKFLEDYSIGELLNERRMKVLKSVVDLALNDLNARLALDVLEKRHNPFNENLPDQPCVKALVDIPFRFTIVNEEELSSLRTAANILVEVDKMYQLQDYSRLGRFLDAAIEKSGSDYVIRKKEEIAHQIIADLNEKVTNANDLYEKASMYAMILNWTDQGPEHILATQFFEDHQEKLINRFKELRAGITSLRIDDARPIHEQIKNVEEVENNITALLPVARMLDSDENIRNGLRQVSGVHTKLLEIKRRIEDFRDDGTKWKECLNTGNWKLVEETVNELIKFDFPKEHRDFQDLVARFQKCREERKQLVDAKVNLDNLYSAKIYDKALEKCDFIDRILARNDTENDPPTDIYWVVHPGFKIYDEYIRKNVYYFESEDGGSAIRSRLEKIISNRDAWQKCLNDFKKSRDQIMASEDIFDEIKSEREFKKSEMEEIDKIIPLIEGTIDELDEVNEGKNEQPNNADSQEMKQAVENIHDELAGCCEQAKKNLEEYEHYEEEIHKELESAIEQIQINEYADVLESIRKARMFYSGSSQKDLSRFLIHISGLLE